MKGEYTFYNDTFEFDECLLHNINKTLNTCSKHIQKIYFLFTSFYLSWKGGRGQCIYFRSFTHIIEFLINIWWQLILIRSQIIIWSYLCDQNWWNIIKKNRYEFLSAFIDQRLPNMVQRLFADVIHDAIWLMNMHEQKYPWFLAM
jgi:hypothetical protein